MHMLIIVGICIIKTFQIYKILCRQNLSSKLSACTVYTVINWREINFTSVKTTSGSHFLPAFLWICTVLSFGEKAISVEQENNHKLMNLAFYMYCLKTNTKGWVCKAEYFRQGLRCTLGLTNNLIDGGQLRAKPCLLKAKPIHVLKTVFSPRLATVYQVVG